MVRELGDAGFLKLCVADGKAPARRAQPCASLVRPSPIIAALADFAFAMQGLGSGAISLFGTVEQKREWLPKVAAARRSPPSP